MFFKHAKTQILAFSQDVDRLRSMTKSASTKKIASHFSDNPVKGVDIAEKLEAVADAYNISKNPKDYIYVAVRALTADIANENHDAFSEKELLTFKPKMGIKTYQTFAGKPHHVNHRSSDPLQARGVILDVHYNTKNAEHFPEILIGVDRTKDKKLAEGIANGEISGFSMGASCEHTICSVCSNKASTPAEFCKHIMYQKGKEIEGKVAFEWCEGVVFEEESSVDDPADKTALTQEVILASKHASNLEMESDILALNGKVAKLNSSIETLINKIEDKDGMKKAASVKKADGISENEDDFKKLDRLQKELVEFKDEFGSVSKMNEDEFIKYKTLHQGIQTLMAKLYKHNKLSENELPENTEKDEQDEQDQSEAEDDLEKYKQKKEQEAIKPLTDAEYGVSPETASKKFKGDTMSANPYKEVFSAKKEAVDTDAKAYWSKYFSGYGKDMTKDTKRKKISVKKEGDSGQMFKSLDNKAGNPPAEFKIDHKKGNPPAEFRFAKVHSDVEVFPLHSKYFVVAKAKAPLYLVVAESKDKSKEAATEFCRKILKSIASKGLKISMSEYKAKSIQALYPAVLSKPSMVDEFVGDLRDKKQRVKPTEGAEKDGTDDIAKFDRSKIKEKGVNEDGVRDIRTSSLMKKRSEDLKKVLDTITEEEGKGTSSEQIVERVKEKIKTPETSPGVTAPVEPVMAKVDAAKMSPEAQKWISSKIEKLINEGKDEDQAAAIAYSMARKKGFDVPEKAASVTAVVTDNAIRDLKGVEKMQPEAKEGVPYSGEDDLAKVKRDDTKANEIYSGGKDDLDVSRKQVVDLKAQKRERLHNAIKESSEKRQIDTVREETKIAIDAAKKQAVEEIKAFKESYRNRVTRALALAATRANINLIDNPLKEAMADVLMTPNRDYIGMDGSLAVNLIENSFAKGAKAYVEVLLKEAETTIDMPEDSFLTIEEDTKRLNLVMPIAEGTDTNIAPIHSPEEMIEGPEDLIERASSANPVFASRGIASGKFANLKGIFRKEM